MSIEVIDGWMGVRELVPEWDELARISGSRAFAFPAWALGCLEQEPARPRVVAARSGRDLIGLGAFAVRSVLGLSALRFAGHWSGQVAGLVLAPGSEAVGSEIWAAAVSGGIHAVQLRHLERRSPPAVPELPGWAVVSRETGICPVVRVEGPFEAFLASRHRDLRSAIARARRRALRDDQEIDVADATTPGAHEKLLPEIAHLARLRLRLDPERSSGMLGELAAGRLPVPLRSMAEAGRLRTLVLRLGGRPAAFTTTLLGAGIVTGFLTAYDPDSSRFSPGHLATAEVVRRAFEDGAHEVDFSLGDVAYKRRWCDGAYTTLDVTAARDPASLVAVSAVGAARSWVRRAGPVALGGLAALRRGRAADPADRPTV